VNKNTVHLGYEVGSADAVEIPVRHMAVTGQTQESGKTTALEALITRSGLAAIAFLTKRGEKSFTSARQARPYFQERADWQFVQAILESTMKEKMKFERAWIVRACQGARTLADVQRKVVELQEKSRSSLSQDVYMLLGEYLKTVVPLIASLPKSPEVQVRPGELTVMDLVSYPEELQILVISSTLDWIHKHGKGVITVIPEAWKFIPQGRNTPVRMVAEKLMREGAALKNYVWLDSQDMAGVDKILLRGCPVWLIGVQREANEIKRALSNMPAGLKKPTAGAVATLEIGQFFACFGSAIRKTYVQPVWLNESAAVEIARGRLSVHDVEQTQTSAQNTEDEMDWKAKFEESERQLADLQRQFDDFRKTSGWQKPPSVVLAEGSRDMQTKPSADGPCGTDCSAPSEERLVKLVLAQVRRDPVLIKLSREVPSIDVKINRTVVAMDDTTIKGRIAVMIAGRFFRGVNSFDQIRKELFRRGLSQETPNVRISKAMSDYVDMGFFYRAAEGGYELVEQAESRVVAN
jgi:hypothetical protein